MNTNNKILYLIKEVGNNSIEIISNPVNVIKKYINQKFNLSHFARSIDTKHKRGMLIKICNFLSPSLRSIDS